MKSAFEFDPEILAARRERAAGRGASREGAEIAARLGVSADLSTTMVPPVEAQREQTGGVAN